MPKIDMFNVVSQLVGYKVSSGNPTPRVLIKNLLPADNAYGFYTGNKVEFYDPIQAQVFYRKFDVKNEKSRCDAVDYINGRIDYYNKLWKDELNKKENLKKHYIPHLPKWSLNLNISSPIIYNKKDPSSPLNKSCIRTLNNKDIYNFSLQLDNNTFIPSFNKMIYEYLEELRSGKNLIPENTLYNPIIEYEDWFMSNGIDLDSVKSLLYINTKSLDCVSPVSHEKGIIHNTIRARYSIKVNPDNIKWKTSEAESKIINLIQNETLDSFIENYKFQNINKINFKKLSTVLKCSDKTAKRIIEENAPYLIYD